MKKIARLFIILFVGGAYLLLSLPVFFMLMWGAADSSDWQLNVFYYWYLIVQLAYAYIAASFLIDFLGKRTSFHLVLGLLVFFLGFVAHFIAIRQGVDTNYPVLWLKILACLGGGVVIGFAGNART